MQIWTVKLRIVMNDDEKTWSKKFSVESDGIEYEYIDGEFWELNTKRYIGNFIPNYYSYNYGNDWHRVIKGFDYLPSDEELETIKKEMTDILKRNLEYRYERVIGQFANKMKALREE